MSDEIVDITAQPVSDAPKETRGEDGLITPDPDVVAATDAENMQTIVKVEERRAEVEGLLPKYPTEWQEEESVSTQGFDEETPDVKISFKEKEVKKIIKKYKKYMKSNLKEIRRVDS